MAAAPRREHIRATLSLFDAALDHTRADRSRALAEGPPQYLVERLGLVPGSPAGRAVWCHHACGIAALDRNDGIGPLHTGWSPDAGRARREIAIAERLLKASADVTDPADWANLAEQASVLCNQAEHFVMA